MPGSKYRLTYFPLKGRAELIRLIFYAARVPFEDRRVAFVDWPNLKPKTLTGLLPMLEINGEKFAESGAIVNWAARKFGLMGKTDAEELKAQAIVTQAIDFREAYLIPLGIEKDPKKIEILKQQLQEGVDKVFTEWEEHVVQTESTGRKIYSYMVTQSMTAADLALLYVADLAEYYMQVDWASFPRLHAVIHTVSDLPHLKAYLTKRDEREKASKPQTTSTPPPQTPRVQTTAPKQHRSSPKSPDSVQGTPRPVC